MLKLIVHRGGAGVQIQVGFASAPHTTWHSPDMPNAIGAFYLVGKVQKIVGKFSQGVVLVSSPEG